MQVLLIWGRVLDCHTCMFLGKSFVRACACCRQYPLLFRFSQ